MKKSNMQNRMKVVIWYKEGLGLACFAKVKMTFVMFFLTASQSCRLDFKAVQFHQVDKLCTSHNDNKKILNECIKLFSLICSLLIVSLLQQI